jgi:hypothetical protein
VTRDAEADSVRGVLVLRRFFFFFLDRKNVCRSKRKLRLAQRLCSDSRGPSTGEENGGGRGKGKKEGWTVSSGDSPVQDIETVFRQNTRTRRTLESQERQARAFAKKAQHTKHDARKERGER